MFDNSTLIPDKTAVIFLAVSLRRRLKTEKMATKTWNVEHIIHSAFGNSESFFAEEY